MEAVKPVTGRTGLGDLLRQARVAQGLSQESLARELPLPLHLLNAIENEDWGKIPPGRERPLTRLIAQRVGLDLEAHREAFETLPGGVGQEPPNPRQEFIERLLMGVISGASLAVMVWLLVPGRSLRSKLPGGAEASRPAAPPRPPYAPAATHGAYPVLGEVLPEPPITDEGIRVSLRTMDASEARITSAAGTLTQSLRVSEPWRTRVKGPFTLVLDNAGVVEVEVAGRRIQHTEIVGESWSASFGADGLLIRPPKPSAETTPPTAPETEPEAESEE